MSQRNSVDSRKKAALRKAVDELLPHVIPVVRQGGSIPLRSIAEAIAGEKIGSSVWRALDVRGSMTFAPGTAGKARFENIGQEMALGLKAFKLKIPERLSGWAKVLDRDQGVVLHFDKDHTLSACKMLLCAGVEAVELTTKRIFVDLEGNAFDRSFDLEAKDGGGGAAAIRAEEKPAGDAKVAVREARQPPEAPARRGEQPTAGAKAPLRSAMHDARSNIDAGVEQTLRSAAESMWAAKQAAHKAARDAKATAQAGVRQTRGSAVASQRAAKEAARRARASARGQLEHSRETLRARGPAAKPGGESRGGGYLGLTTYPVRLPAKLADEHNATGGLLVLGVQPDGPADKAGLLLGDTLLALDGRPIRKPGELEQQLSPDRVGQRLKAVVLRAGKTRHVTVEVGAPDERRDHGIG